MIKDAGMVFDEGIEANEETIESSNDAIVTVDLFSLPGFFDRFNHSKKESPVGVQFSTLSYVCIDCFPTNNY